MKSQGNRYRFSLLAISFVLALWSCQTEEVLPEPTPYTFDVPAYFGSVPQPSQNKATIEGVALGKKLFFDPILSRNNTISCSSCHHPEKAFTDGLPKSVGIDGRLGRRNAMALVNLAWANRFFWDGRTFSLEAQVLLPVPDHLEMDLSWEEAEARLNAHAEYPDLFRRAFMLSSEEPILAAHVAKAISQFMRTLISSDSKFDKFMRGQTMLSPAELRGFDLFRTERADCFHCHGHDGFAQFTNNSIQNNGLDPQGAWLDSGLFLHTGLSFNIGMFKTPTLRNIAVTAPYMHDGRFATLEEVIDHYDSGGHPSQTIDPLMKFVGVGLQLSAQEKSDLVAFLHTLTDEAFLARHAE
jgi:cytochrome c peroxidase